MMVEPLRMERGGGVAREWIRQDKLEAMKKSRRAAWEKTDTTRRHDERDAAGKHQKGITIHCDVQGLDQAG